MTQQVTSFQPRGLLITCSEEWEIRARLSTFSPSIGILIVSPWTCVCWKAFEPGTLFVFVCFSACECWVYAGKCVPSCELCAFIIFNVIPESQWKAANEAHWVSELQQSTPAVYRLYPHPFSTPSPLLARPGYMGITTEMHQWSGDKPGEERSEWR